MKSDGRDNPPNLVQIDTKNTQARQGGSIMYQYYRKTTMESNTENQQGSILTIVPGMLHGHVIFTSCLLGLTVNVQ